MNRLSGRLVEHRSAGSVLRVRGRRSRTCAATMTVHFRSSEAPPGWMSGGILPTSNYQCRGRNLPRFALSEYTYSGSVSNGARNVTATLIE